MWVGGSGWMFIIILYQDILRQQIKVDDISAEARLAHSFDQHFLAKRFRDLQN